MDNKAIIIIVGLLFLLASTSAFVVNIKGDTLYNPAGEGVKPAPNGLSVYPQVVPRYCDITVTSAPNKQVKVYARNYIDTGLGCKTNSNGVCTFRFSSAQPQGTYYVSGNGLQVAVVLDPSAHCAQEISSLYFQQDNVKVAAGVPYIFNTSAYAPDGSAVVPKPVFSLVNASIGTLSYPDYLTPNQVQFVGSLVGTTKIIAEYSGKVATATVTVTPGRCNVLKVSKPDVAYTAGTNATILISTTDRFGNTKSNIEVLVKYAAPDGTVIEKSAYSNEAGKAAVGIPVGTRAGTGRVLVDTKPQLACPDQKSEYYFSVIPSFPASVAIVPQSKTLNVHDMERFKAYVYDEYGNEIKDVNITWESSDASIVSIDSAGVATANRPGSAAVTATVYYDMIAVTPQCAGVFCVPVASLVKVPVSGSAQVTVLNGKADRIVIQPVAPTVVAGGTQQFTATLYDEFNAVVPNAVFTWSATNGTITQGGLYTAPTKTGVDIVNVSSGAVRASTQVTIINGPAAAIKAYSEGPRAVVNTRHVLFANVTDAFGNPVSNVLVNYELLSGDVAPASGQFTTQQDGMGAFVVTAGPTEGKAIYKMAVDGTSIQDDDFFEVYIPDIVLSGVVTDYYTQQPVDGVLVRVEGTQYSATTNATGHYIINGIAQGGKYNVTFSKAGYRSERTEVSLLKDNEDNNYTLNAEIRVYTQVSGTVRNESGSLMQGVNVTLYEGNAYLTSALTDAQGRYAFSIAPGRGSVQFTVTASAPGYDSASAGTVITPGVPVVINLVLRGYDTVPPIIMFVGQTPPDGTYQGGTFTVMTLASDPHYSSTVITVVSGASRSQVASCATQACSASITGGAFPDGAITVIATANDTRGNTASIQNNYYLDYVAPAVTFVAPTPADGSTLDKPFIINVSASDSTGVKKVEIAIVAGGSTVHTEQCAGASVCTYLLNNSVYNGAIQAVATAYSELKSSTEVRAFTVIPPKPVLTSLLIAPSSSSAYVGDTVTITAKALDEKGRPMQNVPIDFTASGGSVPVQHTVTNASGDVRVQYQFQSAGTYTITANSSALSNSTSVTISEVPIASVQLAAVPSSLLVGQVSTVTATVLNARGQPVPNARVSFASSGGIILPSTAATDANGRAVAQFVSLLPGTYEINATVGALRNSTSVLVSVIPPASITVVAVPSEMRTGQTSVVTATVRDALGQPISGATVSFASDGGTIAPLSALTDANGRASAQFSAPVVGVYKVNATVGTITASTNINVNAGSVPTQLRLVASPQTILTIGSSDIVVRVVDQYGDGLPHQQVTFVSSGGTLSAQSAMTNATGYATVKFSAAQVGTYQVNATSGQLANSTYVQVMAVPVATSLTVQASPASVPAGVSSTITATVRDQYGAPMAGQAVQFSATGGSIAPQSAVTGQDGRAVVQFISNAPATYTITAVSGALTNTTAVTVTQPSGTGVLSGTVTDASGAPVQGANVSVMKSYTVLFSTLAGPGGAYSFNIPADTYDIVVEAQGYLPVRDYGVRVLDGGTTVKNYQLTKLSRLYGYVLNSTGSPVAGATLKAYRNGNLAGTAISQANGAYEFKLAAGVYVVETTHPSYQRALYTVYLPPTTELAKDVTLYR